MLIFQAKLSWIAVVWAGPFSRMTTLAPWDLRSSLHIRHMRRPGHRSPAPDPQRQSLLPDLDVGDYACALGPALFLAYQAHATARVKVGGGFGCAGPASLLFGTSDSLASVYGAQVLLATHSPVVLNAAKAPEVLCFAKDEEGATDIVAGAEHPKLSSWQGKVNMGTLLAAGVLG